MVGGGIGSGVADIDVGVLTSCMTPEYQRPSGPGAHTLVPMIERLAKRRLVDILLNFTHGVYFLEEWGVRSSEFGVRVGAYQGLSGLFFLCSFLSHFLFYDFPFYLLLFVWYSFLFSLFFFFYFFSS